MATLWHKRFLFAAALMLGSVFMSRSAAQAQSATLSDFGDAPDSSNTTGLPMSAYPSINGQYPTADTVAGGVPAPFHQNTSLRYFLGYDITGESAADGGTDLDGIFNLNPNTDAADYDQGDDGLQLPSLFPHCQMIQLTYTVTVLETSRTAAYLNLWIDWNKDGAWGTTTGLTACPGNNLPTEWAVQNQSVDVSSPGKFTVQTPAFWSWNSNPTVEFWVRATLSDQPATHADGRGVSGGFAYGETEDYRTESALPKAVQAPLPTTTPTVLTSGLQEYNVFLPIIQRAGGGTITNPSGTIKEVDLATIGGDTFGAPTPVFVTFAGTGAAGKLTTWRLNNNVPQSVTSSTALLGANLKLHVLTPAVTPKLNYEMFVSGLLRDGDLWLSSWQTNSNADLFKLSTRGYGSNAGLDVADYAIGHRELRNGSGALTAWQVVTAVRTTGGSLRVVTWSVDPATGNLVGKQDSGNLAQNLNASALSVATIPGETQTGGTYYTVGYRTGSGVLGTLLVMVNAAGKPSVVGQGASGVDIRGVNAYTQTIDSHALASLTSTGFVSANWRAGSSTMSMSSWHNQELSCDVNGCTFAPHFISNNASDTLPTQAGIGLSVPSIISDRATVLDLPQNFLSEQNTLYTKSNTTQQGIASVTKVLTLIVTLDRVKAGLVSLDGTVTISAAAANVGGSQMGVSKDEQQSLRNLLYGMIIASGNDASLAIAEYVGGSEANFATLLNNKVAALGLANTVYCNAYGGCFSTSEAQTAIWRSAYQDSDFQMFAGESSYNACGTLNNIPVCYNLSRNVAATYPGLDSWKGGSLGFFCSGVSGVPLCASGGCLTSQANRLDRTIIVQELHPQPKTPNRWADARSLFDYAFQRIFTPDYLGQLATTVNSPLDFALDAIDDRTYLSAVVDGNNVLQVCSYAGQAGTGAIEAFGCTNAPNLMLADGVRGNFPVHQISLVPINNVLAENNYLSGTLESGKLVIREWQLGKRDTP